MQCLCPVYACHGLDCITVEGVGNAQTGYHPAQERLYECSGTQCGYCSSGMIINMYSLLESAAEGDGQPLTASDVENSFGGNLCRCTGYRPIMDAFKALAVTGERCTRRCAPAGDLDDIEDLGGLCGRAGGCEATALQPLVLRFADDSQWHRVTEVQQIFDIWDRIGGRPYQLVAGNTGHGVYRRSPAVRLFIDVNGVVELRSHRVDADAGTLSIGANVNLTETMAILRRTAATQAGFEYCERVRTHIDLIANVPVRNAGTIAGNLSLKHAHNEFPSDLFLVLETIGALIEVRHTDGHSVRVTLVDYLRMDMQQKLLIAVQLPRLPASDIQFRSFKIMPRAQNAHAYVNAGFLAQIAGGKVTSMRICYGGIAPRFVHAAATEAVLVGRDWCGAETLSLAVRTLSGELRPDWELPDPDPVYRKRLAIALFYKFVLDTVETGSLPARLRSGGQVLERPLSSGVQEYDTRSELYPLTEPVRKLEGLMQVSGAAMYANDLPPVRDQLWAAYVLAGRPHVTIGRIDATAALVSGWNDSTIEEIFLASKELEHLVCTCLS